MPLIVLEGPEGVGKTTQLALLHKRLESAGQRVLSLREPGNTWLGDVVRDALLNSKGGVSPVAESYLFMAARAQLIAETIRPALMVGTTVLLDRFFLSTYAYQAAGRGLPIERIQAANSFATASASVSVSNELRPDVTVLLSLPVGEGLKRAKQRGHSDRMESAAEDFHQRVATAFAEYATREWQAEHPEAGRVVTVDAHGSVEEVHERIFDAVVRARIPGVIR